MDRGNRDAQRLAGHLLGRSRNRRIERLSRQRRRWVRPDLNDVGVGSGGRAAEGASAIGDGADLDVLLRDARRLRRRGDGRGRVAGNDDRDGRPRR